MVRDYTVETQKIKKKLVEKAILSAEQLDTAINKQKKTNNSLLDIIVDLEYAEREPLMHFISDVIDVPYVKLDIKLIDPDIINIVSKKLAMRYKLIPVIKLANTLTVAMTDPFNLYALQELKFSAEVEIEPLFCSEEDIISAINYFYTDESINGNESATPSITPIVEPTGISKAGSMGILDLDRTEGISITDTATDFAKQLEDQTSLYRDEKAKADEKQSPIIKITNTIIRQAIMQNVSDVHFEPTEDKLRVRYRIDGVLKVAHILPQALSKLVISRLKIMSRMNITERRLPQDGVFIFKYADREIDCRIATTPTVYGESAIIRLLHQSNRFITIDELGVPGRLTRKLRNAITQPSGFILVTGPTGSGKTTTLYALLNEINSEKIKIITVEDPVEYRIAGVNQIQMHHQIGLDFAKALRSILRQDPDVILVGEVRDRETAQTTVQAVLTGHLLFSTLHTTNSVNSVIRLMDLGIEYFYIREVLSLVISQRLVRKLCPHCKEEYKPSQAEFIGPMLDQFESKKGIFRAVGCEKCSKTGYKERIPVFEMLFLDENITSCIDNDTKTKTLWAAARESGMMTLWESAIELVSQGMTSIEEITAKIPRPMFLLE